MLRHCQNIGISKKKEKVQFLLFTITKFSITFKATLLEKVEKWESERDGKLIISIDKKKKDRQTETNSLFLKFCF